jgi:hypothetical protein
LNGIALNEFDKLDKVVEKNGWIKTIKYDLIIIAINDTVELERVQAQDCTLLLPKCKLQYHVAWNYLISSQLKGYF